MTGNDQTIGPQQTFRRVVDWNSAAGRCPSLSSVHSFPDGQRSRTCPLAHFSTRPGRQPSWPSSSVFSPLTLLCLSLQGTGAPREGERGMGTPVQPAEPLALPPLQSRIQLFSKTVKVQIPKPPLPTLGRSVGGQR